MTYRSRTLAIVSLAAALLATGCGGADETVAGDEAGAVVGARTALAVAQPFTETIAAIGTVSPRAGHVATLSAAAPARIARVLVTPGERVAAGQALVELDHEIFQAAAQSAQAAVSAAEKNDERTQRLAQEGIAPRKDAEQSAADLAKARADLVLARREEQLATLRSPIDGVVMRMTAVLGGTADPAQPLVEVADPSQLDILLTVTPGEAGRIRPGATVSLSGGESASGESLGMSVVADISGTVDSTSRGVVIRVRAPSSRRVLRIGETVHAQIAVTTRANAVVVPIEALVPEGDGFKVFVVDDSSIAHERPVTVGGRTDKVAEITEGLSAGERVVTYGAYGVEDSVKVVPLEGTPPE